MGAAVVNKQRRRELEGIARDGNITVHDLLTKFDRSNMSPEDWSHYAIVVLAKENSSLRKAMTRALDQMDNATAHIKKVF